MIEFGEKSKFESRFERNLSEPKDVSSDSRLSDTSLLVLAEDLYLVIPEDDEDGGSDEDENDGDDADRDDEDSDDEDGGSFEVIDDCLVTKILTVTFSCSTF